MRGLKKCLPRSRSTDNKFLSVSPRARVCTVTENAENKANSVHKQVENGNSCHFFSILFVIFIWSMSSGVLVILLL